MSILFYDHLVKKEPIIILIDRSEEPDNRKFKAKQLIDDIIHHELLHFILERLEDHKHHTFLSLIEERPYDPEIIAYLQDHISPQIESEIERFADELIEKIKTDFENHLELD